MASTVQTNAFSFGPLVWWFGVIEDRMDPEHAGRVRVRVFGYHTADTGAISTEQLMWATVMTPISSASISGVGVSPTGILPGSHCIGFFADGSDAQTPVIFGTYPGIPQRQNASEDGSGFGDPSGTYPKYPLGEPDTNRLARNEHIDETIVQKKKDNRNKGISEAFGGTWDEPETDYNAEYPYNHVRETESGHIEEFDDTEGSERYHLYHRKGTFKEIQHDGTQVEKIVKDHYMLVLGDDYLYVKGNVQITVDGNVNALVKGNANIDVKGNVKEQVDGNYSLKIGGTYTVSVGGTWSDTAGGIRTIKAPMIYLN